MLIEVKRFEFKDTHTIGKMYLDGQYECYTLEDVVRKGAKVNGQTAIPTGTYNLIINHSNRFNRDLPLLENVPNFTGVRIHAGNTSAHTEGCILVGTTWSGKDFIGNSRVAFNKLFEKLKKAKTATIKISSV
jgi:hypothetical protein